MKLTYKTGSAFSGTTTLEIERGGKATVAFEQGKRNESYEGEVPKELSEQFWSSFEEAKPLEATRDAERLLVPGEVPLHFTLENGAETQENTLMSNDVKGNPALAAFEHAIKAVLAQVSGGKVLY